MLLKRDFLSSNMDKLDLKDYRRIRKICDDAIYYDNHRDDYELFKVGTLLAKVMAWPMEPMIYSDYRLSEDTISEAATVLDYNKKQLVRDMRVNSYDVVSLKFFKIFSDIAFYCNDYDNDRLNLLDIMIRRKLIETDNNFLNVYDFTKLPVYYNKNTERYFYHPLFFESSSLYRISSFSNIVEDKDYGYILGFDVEGARKKVMDAFKRYPSFKETWENVQADNIDPKDYSNLPKNKDLRVLLDYVAEVVWSKDIVRDNLLKREASLLVYLTCPKISSDLTVMLNSGLPIFDPCTNSAELYYGQKFLPTRFSYYKDERDTRVNIKDKDDMIEFRNAMYLAVSNGFLVKEDINHFRSKGIKVPTVIFDALSAFHASTDKRLFEKFTASVAMFDNTYDEKLCNYEHIDISQCVRKDYFQMEGRALDWINGRIATDEVRITEYEKQKEIQDLTAKLEAVKESGTDKQKDESEEYVETDAIGDIEY